MATTDKFRFRKHDSIGAAAAEDDEKFLEDCFVDTGDLTTLLNCSEPKRIILGRTGAGKTALIQKVDKEKKNVIMINPESLSFNYLANSTILKFFLEAGVKLDIFFKLLWRHVFTVELLKKRYNIVNDIMEKTFLDRIKHIITKNKNKERAINYIMQWGDKFWFDTEYRIIEIASKIETELKNSVGADLNLIKLATAGASKITEEEKKEVVQRGQPIINRIQMKELSDILDFLNDNVFDDDLQKFYICIDRLDENWVEDRFRYVLIRSLIETVKDFKKVRNVKIIVALRIDLIDRVFKLTRDPGFQEEKYRSLFLNLSWTESQLKTILNARVNYLIKQTYTKGTVKYSDLLPRYIEKNKPAADYIIDRTLRRPRELIEFFNLCMEKAEGKTTISKTTLFAAEGDYSKNIIRSLQDEWYADYPGLIEFAFILKRRNNRFTLGDITKMDVESFCLDYIIKYPDRNDRLSGYAKDVVDGIMSGEQFLCFLFSILYKTGIIGIKTESFETYQWSYQGPISVSSQAIDLSSKIQVHPAFWRVLGIKI